MCCFFFFFFLFCCCRCRCRWLVPIPSSRAFFVVPVKMNRARCSLLTHARIFHLVHTSNASSSRTRGVRPSVYIPSTPRNQNEAEYPPLRAGGGRPRVGRKRPSGLHASIMWRAVRFGLGLESSLSLSRRRERRREGGTHQPSVIPHACMRRGTRRGGGSSMRRGSEPDDSGGGRTGKKGRPGRGGGGG